MTQDYPTTGPISQVAKVVSAVCNLLQVRRIGHLSLGDIEARK
jgi:hypothetical protein